MAGKEGGVVVSEERGDGGFQGACLPSGCKKKHVFDSSKSGEKVTKGKGKGKMRWGDVCKKEMR